MQVFYENEHGILYHGDCLEVMDWLSVIETKANLVLTDPPYFRVKGESWDRQWKEPEHFLEWLGLCANAWRDILAPSGSLYCFASPQMSARVECEIRKSFNVLSNIRWVKKQGWHKKAKKEDLRQWLAPSETIVFAEQYGCEYQDAAKALHKEVYAPIGRYLQTERERAGLTRNDVEVALGFVSSGDPTRGTALCYRWEEGSSLPTKETYDHLRRVLGGGSLRREYEYLRREYEDLRREYEDLRRPFFVSDAVQNEDIWHFNTVAPYPGKHVCEKPIDLLEHVINASSRQGETILDSFAGSGTTAVAAQNTGRKWILCEKEEKYCDMIAKRLEETNV